MNLPCPEAALAQAGAAALAIREAGCNLAISPNRLLPGSGPVPVLE